MPSPSRFCLPLLAALFLPPGLPAASVSYDAVEEIISRHCLECHEAKDPEGGLSMESHAGLLKGGESGPAFSAGNSTNSLMIRAVEGRWEKGGKTKIMPPGKKTKLSPEQIKTLKDWIDAGATPTRSAVRKELIVPHVPPRHAPRRSIQSIASSPADPLIAVGRYAEVEIRSTENQTTLRTLSGHRGNVNSVAFSKDGRSLVSVAGQPGVSGEIRLWNPADGTLIRSIVGHRDAVYSVDISPDDALIASGSYDQEIHLWKISDGSLARTLHGHNGAVYDLAFRPDGKVLASASGDRTVKLWDVATGKRLDTLSQSARDLHSLVWSPDGTRLFAAGIDNRIRVWQISAQATETTNPLLDSRFAHEGAILSLAASADGKWLASSASDRTVKLWDLQTLLEKRALEAQADLAPGLAFASAGKQLVVGRLDGSLTHYDAVQGTVQKPSPPELQRAQPGGVRRDRTTLVRVVGKNLSGVTAVRPSDPRIQVKQLASDDASSLTLEVKADADLARGRQTLTVEGPGGTSNALALWIDDIDSLQEKSDQEITQSGPLPVAWWGSLEKPGDTDTLEFEAEAGHSLVIDVSARELGSKLNPRVELISPDGLLLAGETAFDGGDPLLPVTIAKPGRYRLIIKDDSLTGSEEHSYRISIGSFAYAVAAYPPAVSVGKTETVELVGYNLPKGSLLQVTASEAGEMSLAVDTNVIRTRKALTVLAVEATVVREVEPNQETTQATLLTVPAEACGRVDSARVKDRDCFSFKSGVGRTWVVETDAARKGSPIDTRIEILFPDGRPVPQTRLQAVRNTAINFRGVDAINADLRLDHYEEMELNEFLYLNGDIMKLLRMPQGPDSGMQMYSLGGKRRAYFGTTATAHPLDESGFIVVPHAPNESLVSNGLPSFLLNYENDDDGDRRLGSDSRLIFTAPSEGTYIVRVTDAIGRGGPRFSYRLSVREPRPGFKVTLEGAAPTVRPGTGQNFTLRAERFDGFEGPIRVGVSGLPPGFTLSGPLVIEAGHLSASGVLNASVDAPKPTDANANTTQVTAEAEIEGRFSIQAVNSFGKIALAEGSPTLSVSLTAYAGQDTTGAAMGAPASLEVVIQPGQMVSAWLSVQRKGHEDTITFDVNNLPHGVIVDNLGLNGITFLKGENGRQIFLTASKWVKAMERPFYAQAAQAGRPASLPVLLKVRP